MEDTRFDARLRELLYVLATRAEAEHVAGRLVHAATARQTLTGAPTLSITADWPDTCNLLGLYADESGTERSAVTLPHGVGIWRICLEFDASGTEDEVDDVAYKQMGIAVDECIRGTVAAKAPSVPSAAEGMYYFSLIDVPDRV